MVEQQTAEVVLAQTLARIEGADRAAYERTEAALDAKTKPRRSLGRLEELACRIAAIRGDAAPRGVEAAVVVAAADHGVAREGVSAYPQEVTRQMLLNFADGGAAICVLARQADVGLVVVDCLSLWVANLLECGREPDLRVPQRPGPTIVVSNEVGLGVVPATPLGREYRDVLGRVNALWAEAADEAYFVVAGRALPLARTAELLALSVVGETDRDHEQ